MQTKFISYSFQSLGTRIEIILPSSYKKLLIKCEKECKRIDDKYSRFKHNNTLSQINSNLNCWQEIDSETHYLISQAITISSDTQGAFSLFTKELLENWGYDSEYSFKDKKIEGLTTQGDLKLKANKLYISKVIELGGLGKGYAIDQLVLILKEVPSYYINAGGDVYAKGTSPENTPWIILLENPNNTEYAIGEVELDGQALCSSSQNRRSWNNYSHIINTTTHLPAKGVSGVFTLHKSTLLADAYATALIASQTIKLQSELNCESIIVDLDNKISKTAGLRAKFYK